VKAAPFSEPRIWVECETCRTNPLAHCTRVDDQGHCPVEPCFACGQPPRCRVGGSGKDQCSRPATVSFMDNTGVPDFCGQHYVASDLQWELDEWGIARDYLKHFYGARMLLLAAGFIFLFMYTLFLRRALSANSRLIDVAIILTCLF
jgi:hypothetical protein